MYRNPASIPHSTSKSSPAPRLIFSRTYIKVEEFANSLYEAGKQARGLLIEARLNLESLDSRSENMSEAQRKGACLGFQYASCIGNIERDCALLKIPNWHKNIFSLNHKFSIILGFSEDGRALDKDGVPPKSYVRLCENIERMIRKIQNPDKNSIATSLAEAHQVLEVLRFLPRSEGAALRESIKTGYWIGRHIAAADRVLSVQCLEDSAKGVSELQKGVGKLLLLQASELPQDKRSKQYQAALSSFNKTFNTLLQKLEFFDKFGPPNAY